MIHQPGFDLTQFDSEATNLDLKIVAAQKLDVAIGKPPAQIPGPVHPRFGIIAERILEELLRRQLRTVQISTRYSSAANVQLT